MKRAALLLILVLFGVFVFMASIKGVLIWPVLVPIALLVVFYAIISGLVTEKMVRKVRSDDIFFVRASMIVKEGTDLLSGALVIGSGEIMFYQRKNWNGGVMPAWSSPISSVESYSLKKVDEHHPGILITLVSGEEHSFTSRSISKKEDGLRAALGWDEKP